MLLRLREKLKRLRRLQLAVVVTLSLALLALPCTPLATAFGSNSDQALAAATAAHPGHPHRYATDDTKEHDSNCCIDCSAWLTASFEDGTAGIISHNWSRGDLFPITLAHAPFVANTLARERRFPRPLSVVDGTTIYAKTQRYRI